MLSEKDREEILELAAQYAEKQAAGIESLKIVQERYGWVSDEHVKDISSLLEMEPAELENVATFYSLIFRRPVGRHVVYVCDSISCWIMGSSEVASRLRELLGVGFGETSGDGRFTLLPISCVGACDHAPALRIDRDTYTQVGVGELKKILEGYS